jgi:hypothetical protein
VTTIGEERRGARKERKLFYLKIKQYNRQRIIS